MSEDIPINNPHRRSEPPVFDSLQELNKAECALIWCNYAKEAESEGDHTGAQMGFYNAWSEQPEEFRYFQAVVGYLNRAGQVDPLIKVYEIGIQLFPHHVETFVSFSNLLNLYGFYERAKQVIEALLARDPSCLPGWGNLGNALRGLGDYQGARDCFRKILAEEPGNVIAAFNLSNVLLSQEEYEQGWPLYDHRLLLPGYERLRHRNTAPVWKGESLESRSILVYAEQGLGDTFMFSRYLRMLAEAGARVHFEVQKPIAWLMEDSVEVDMMVIERESLDTLSTEKTDYQVSLLSLAGIAHQRGWGHEPVGYLEPNLGYSHRAKELLNGLEGIKVGLCWQGNPHAAIDCGRSLVIESLEPLMDLHPLEFISLQGKDGLEGIETCFERHKNFNFLPDLDSGMRAYAESVVLIDGVDLVITTDTAIAHLVGAMGKPCWVLLQKYPEWRWGLTSDITPWYPSMRLFRQEIAGDWTTLVSQVKEALTAEYQIPHQGNE